MALKKINKGTGAGGKKTNKNGLLFENTSLFSENKIITCEQHFINKKCFEKFILNNQTYYNSTKYSLYNLIPDYDKDVCKNKKLIPDEFFVNLEQKQIYILEKKFQQTSGSVDEKIQSADFKRFHYKKIFPNYSIHFSFVFNDWFKKNKYKSEFEYFNLQNIQFFFNSDENYFSNIINWLKLNNPNYI